ncbi:pollen-specific leucine-rich repeat extensin-like protein 3 [Thrips palmi]|uniref:Pollen-specific leucine-rich repeat extensin-like protein 3 n=1 Tax=Thrips palmi TaxID=161013 RepID=A0A6P8ZZF3_THRPL|nr:pollen-specific leucine-rich repeat extensin-like protein 3 [Thrips palmi]
MISVHALLLALLAAALHGLHGVRAGYLHGPVPLPLHPPVVSYGYHTAVVSKPLVHPVPLAPPLHYPYHPYHPLPPPVIIKPIATSYQSFHKVDRPVYPIHYVKPLPLPLHPAPLPLPLHPAPLHPLPLPLAYSPHYPHYLH